jgi:hypothetical protein
MKKIKLFSASKNKKIEGDDAELYVNFYLVFSRNYIFTFLIDSPDLACSDRNPIRLWKHWLMLFEEECVKYLRRSENAQRNKSLAYLSGINDGLNVIEQVCKKEEPNEED